MSSPTAMHGIHGNVNPQTSLTMGAFTDGTVEGAAVTLSGSFSWEIVITLGLWTDGTHVISFEASVDGGATWTAVDKEDLDGVNHPFTQHLDTATGNTITVDSNARVDAVIGVAYFGYGKQLRIKVVTTGSTTGLLMHGAVWPSELRDAGTTPGNVTAWDAKGGS